MNLLSLVLAIALLVNYSTASAHMPSDPNFLRPDSAEQWQTLSTTHFRIHHLASHKEYAQRMGAIAERVHNKLSAWLGWQPEDKTEIVVLDTVDYSNGAATVLPYNQFYIYMPTPVDGDLLDQNPWMEYVFTHEYVHILHLDMVAGQPKEAREFLGRPVELMTAITFPQIFAPSWVTEGLAVYGESDNSAGYGRLNNAWYAAKMRLEVQRGLRSLTEVSFEGYSGSRWPYGLNYLYGAYFFKFINERYGRDMVGNYIRIYGANLIPWRMDKRSTQIFGKPAEQVWGEFQEYLRQRFEPQLALLKQQSDSKPIYTAPYINNSLTAAKNGDLYFYHDDSSSSPQIRRITADGKNESLFEADHVVGLDWNDHAGLLINKTAVCDNIKLYAELYLWKPGMSSPEKLTECGRYVHAAWRADGKQIAAVQLNAGMSQLSLLDANAKNPEQLAELPIGDSIGDIAWSPDSTQLVASVKRQHTGWNLELFDLAKRSWQPLTLNNDLEIHPHFSVDGRDVYFISDHAEVWNLRRIHLADQTIETLSDSISSIYEAVAMPDNSYRMVEYTAQGMSINSLMPTPLASYAAFSPTPPKIDAIANAADYRPLPYDKVQDYSALDTLKPRSWVPFLALSNNQNSLTGVSLYGADVLGFHQWSVSPYLYTNQRVLGGYASYSYLNTLTLNADQQSIIYGEIRDPLQYRSDKLRYQALLHHSFNSTNDSLYIAGGVSSETIKESLTQNSNVNSTYQNTLSGIIVRYDNTEFYQHSISRTDGRTIQLNSESYDVFSNNTNSGTTHQLDWKEYIDLGASHVLYLRLLMARGDNGIRPYNLGGNTENKLSLNTSSSLGQRSFTLRGYPSGLASLSGTQMDLARAEWRIPLGMVYDGFFAPPVGLGKHSFSVFVDTGDAWSQGEAMQRKTGAGLAWNGEALIGYDLLHVGITIGAAHGFDQGGTDQYYFRIGLPF